MGMEHVGPFIFNGIRFALGCIVLFPFIVKRGHPIPDGRPKSKETAVMILGGASAGLSLFAGASLQQAGLVYTTAGNAGFITGLYVIMVPVFGLLGGRRTHPGTWIGALSAAVGLYLLSITAQFTIALGDLLVLLGTFFWAGHVLILAWLSPRMASVKLALVQYGTCSVLSFVAAALFESTAWNGIIQATVPILYGGVMSVGIAYTLQVVAQRHAHPAHASILLSLESVFAALGGWIFLGETLSFRGFWGCALMLAGMLFSQLWECFAQKSAGDGLA